MVRTSHRQPREWLWLIVAVVVVGAVCVPLWEFAGRPGYDADFRSKWTPERLGRLFLGPEQIACYACMLWAGLIILNRSREVRRQHKSFRQELLPIEEGARILPEDARPLIRKIDQTVERKGPSILATMSRLALGKYSVSRSAADAAEVVRVQADVEQGRLAAGMATVHYLAWAIPAIGFLGTVRGLAGGMSMATVNEESTAQFLDQATRHLAVAFDCTFIALALSLFLMYLLHAIQRLEESLVLDCQQYCQEHLLLRLYDPARSEPPTKLSVVSAS
ncbi:MAG: MotA/TolQ/ExbB proton channel family protein [Gemmataceae bacterium]|nr:MotA/TolQ/ExbB proton channel family protein [Gemmataceae bacterium]